MKTFFAPGRAATKGSTTSFWDQKRKKIRTIGDNQSKQSAWARVVAIYALEARLEFVAHPGPVSLHATFWIERPKSHFEKAGPRKGLLRTDAPPYPTEKNRNDDDKLQRCLFDALAGLAYENDSQVIDQGSSKFYATATSEPGVLVSVGRYVPS